MQYPFLRTVVKVCGITKYRWKSFFLKKRNECVQTHIHVSVVAGSG